MENKESRRSAKEYSTGASLSAGTYVGPPLLPIAYASSVTRHETVPVDIEARKQSLTKNGSCYICLRRNHVVRKCHSSTKYTQCDGRHHVAVCFV